MKRKHKKCAESHHPCAGQHADPVVVLGEVAGQRVGQRVQIGRHPWGLVQGLPRWKHYHKAKTLITSRVESRPLFVWPGQRLPCTERLVWWETQGRAWIYFFSVIWNVIFLQLGTASSSLKEPMPRTNQFWWKEQLATLYWTGGHNFTNIWVEIIKKTILNFQLVCGNIQNNQRK